MKRNTVALAAGLIFAALASSTRADMVTDWNQTAEVVIRTGPPSPPLQIRALAIVNAALFDAVNGITRKYEPYFVDEPAPPGARPEAAVAAAGVTALKGLFPAQAALLDQKFAKSVASIPGHQGNSQSIAHGLAWGEHVAQLILAARANDGLTTPTPPYLGGNEVGQWRAIPNGGVPGALPQFAKLVPFTMSSSSQFRPGPPPALDSPQYAADFDEVKAIGRVDSTVRTPEQSQICLLWANSGALEENAIIRSIVPSGYNLDDTARLFALANFSACDGMIAGFDAKYHYGFWRPFHAIHFADLDGNSATDLDPAWTSFIPAPNHPEYISTHSTVTGAGMHALSLILGDNVPFILSSPALPGITIDYSSFSEAAVEVGLSRVWGGIHFRNSCETGRAVGYAVAEQAVANFLKPVRGESGR